MNLKRITVVILLCFVAMCMIAAVAPPAYAAAGDTDQMERKGIEGLFKGRGTASDDPRLPTPLQKWAGIGSIAVMIIVVKYL